MSGYVDNALFVYSTAGEVYLDLVGDNPFDTTITSVSYSDFSNNREKYSDEFSHLVVSAELSTIKEVMKYAIEQSASLGILPLPSQKTLMRSYGLSGTPEEMLALALGNDPSIVDIVFCNDQILLFKGVIGRVPLFDTVSDYGRLGILWSGLRRIFSLRLLPFQIETKGAARKRVDTAASGCLIVENPEGSFTSGIVGHDCSINDGLLSAVVIAPFSIIDYLKLMWLRLRSNFHISRIETAIGFIKTTDLKIDTDVEKSVTIDGEKITSTPAHFHVKPAALRLNHAKAGLLKGKKGKSAERVSIKSLPAGKEVAKAVNKRVPFFSYASEERFKDLFIALRDDAQLNSTYIVLMILSTVLATVGLYLNSASVVIGAMLLAPLMAPIISLAMSLLRFDRRLFRQSIWKIVVGVLIALTTAMLLTGISPYQPLTVEMQGRLHPSVLDLLVAIAAGVAGAYTKSHKEIAQSLAGVAIAVALVPPLAVAGIGLGRFEPSFFGFAFLLFLTNLIGIILAATFTFRLLGYSPIVRNKRGIVTITLFFLLICIPLTIAFYDITAQAKIENSWKTERFVVNGKYLIVEHARLHELKENDLLVVKVQARELLNRYDLSEFRRKVEQNFGRHLTIRVNVTYIP